MLHPWSDLAKRKEDTPNIATGNDLTDLPLQMPAPIMLLLQQ